MHRRVAVLVPALNEEATIGGVVRQCLAALGAQPLRGEVIVVDDGSSDRTAAVAREAGARVVSHARNMGVGRAFHTGLSEAIGGGADILVNIDADGQFDPADIPALIRPILEGRADFVTASRFKDPALTPAMPAARLYGNRLMSALISRIAGVKLYDVSCGFRAYDREAMLHLNLWGHFTYTQESILNLAAKEMRIEEVPIRVLGERPVGRSRVARSLVRYGVRTMKIILRTYRDFWPLHFFGWLAALFALPGSCLVLFLFAHRLRAGRFSPHIWAGFTGGGLVALGLFVLAVGLAAEMLKRIRLNQEMMLYYLRRQACPAGMEDGSRKTEERMALHTRLNESANRRIDQSTNPPPLNGP